MADMKCPRCKKQMVPHATGTFTEDGFICTNCGYVQKQLEPIQRQTGLIVKGWKKRDDSDLEDRLKQWELKRDD